MIGAARSGVLAQDHSGPVDRSALDPTGLSDRQSIFDRPDGCALARKERRNNRSRKRNDQKRCHDRGAALTLPLTSAFQHQSRTE
jgi:hypothetical protein